MSVDPLTDSYAMLTPYAFAANKVINGIDLDGLEWVLRIYSPMISSDFLEAKSKGDILRMKDLTYYAMNRKFPDTYAKSVTIQSSSDNMAASMEYDPTISGLKIITYTGVYDKSGELIGSVPNLENPITYALNISQGRYKDLDWPVDIRSTRAYEEKFGEFYKSADGSNIDLKILDVQGAEGYSKSGSRGSIIMRGYLKGYGAIRLGMSTNSSDGIGTDVSLFGRYEGIFTGLRPQEAPLLGAVKTLDGAIFKTDGDFMINNNWSIFGGHVGFSLPWKKYIDGAQEVLKKTESELKIEVLK